MARRSSARRSSKRVRRNGSLVLGPERIDATGTKSLRSMKKLRARYNGDLSGALESAGYYAKKSGQKTFVYAGNSYGHSIWRVSTKRGDYLDPINNTGRKVAAVTPDLTMSWFDVER
jgi:hypothetical protein